MVGGGLAGLAAALELVDAGCEVAVLEARPTLGGAVQTLPERAADPPPPPDNGQHIALGCFERYLRFLQRIGKTGAIRRDTLALPVIDADGRVAVVRPGALGLLRYRHLSLAGRVRVARVARGLGRARESDNEDRTFGALLRSLGQRPAEIDRFWDVFIRPALNLPAEEAGAAYGIFTVKTALLAGPGASDLLLPAEPLGEMHGSAAGRALARAGAQVRVDARVVEIASGAAVLADGGSVEADAFVVAVPPAESARLLGEAPARLEDSPIVSVHLLFDRPLLEQPLAALLKSPAHWVFDRGVLTGHPPGKGQYLTVVSSGVPELLELRGRELVETMRRALTDRLGAAELLWSRVSREPRATFAPRPGTNAARPSAETARPDVFRAGAWTATRWPATMEGAVRSGERAAQVLLSDRKTRVPA